METPHAPPESGAASGEETPTQRQARLRRERREAKIKEQGTSRLEKITKLSGRQQLPGRSASPQSSSQSPALMAFAALLTKQ